MKVYLTRDTTLYAPLVIDSINDTEIKVVAPEFEVSSASLVVLLLGGDPAIWPTEIKVIR